MLVPLLATLCAILLIILILGRRGTRSKEYYQDISGADTTQGTLRDLLIDNYGTGIIWGAEYNDLYSLQETYIAAVDGRAELERSTGATAISCRPDEVERLLDGSASLEGARKVIGCLPTVDNARLLAEFLVREIKGNVAQADNALNGNLSPVIEEFAPCIPCTPVPPDITALNVDAGRRVLSADERKLLRELLSDGMDAKRRADAIQGAAQTGTLSGPSPSQRAALAANAF